jgi:hypothetical protein
LPFLVLYSKHPRQSHKQQKTVAGVSLSQEATEGKAVVDKINYFIIKALIFGGKVNVLLEFEN